MSNELSELDEYRRSIFGVNSAGETMPHGFFRELRRLADGAEATLGIRDGEKARTAFWIKGRTLGQLICTGSNDADAKITGRVLRLDQLAQIDIEVKTAPGVWDDSPWMSGRILKIDGDTLFDATPGKFAPDKLEQVDRFIDRVLAAFG